MNDCNVMQAAERPTLQRDEAGVTSTGIWIGDHDVWGASTGKFGGIQTRYWRFMYDIPSASCQHVSDNQGSGTLFPAHGRR